MDNHVDDADSSTSSSEGFTARHVAISVIPHFTGLLSVIGSLWIIIDILRNRKKKLGTTYHRLLLGMSLSDVAGSAAMALSTWPIPSTESGVVDGGSVFGASGTQATCNTQAFFVQLGMAAPLYSGFLSLYYLLMVRYNWSENSKKMRLLENVFHGFAWVLALGTSCASLGLDLYNSANLWCWIAPLPLDCVSSAKADDGNGTCVRGDNAWIYRLAFYFIWIWIALICVTVFMAMVFWTVYSQTRTMNKYNHGGVKSCRNKNVGRVAAQAGLYVGAFYLTIISPSVARMTQARWNCTSEFFPLSILTVTFYPLQGFWNFFIYMRPRYLRYRKEHKDWSIMHVLSQIFRKTMCCSASSDEELTSETRLELGKNTRTTAVSGTTPSSTAVLKSQISAVSEKQDTEDSDLKKGEEESPATAVELQSK